MHVYYSVALQQTSYISVLLPGADRIENNFPSIVACIRVYKAVAWQSVDQFCYIIFPSGFSNCIQYISVYFLVVSTIEVTNVIRHTYTSQIIVLTRTERKGDNVVRPAQSSLVRNTTPLTFPF
jgi:hypothetical protein